MAELPPPMQVGDFYLEAILDEIKGLRADLEKARAPVVVNNGPTELREPKAERSRPTPAPQEDRPSVEITEGGKSRQPRVRR
jgi:hypothetical protein